jgi:phosphoglycolate phosphatase-like HAD superfamily hydrolase
MKMPSGASSIEVKLDALLFDFDGVILESADIKTDAFRELFADQPDHVEEIVALHQRYGGVSRHVKFSMIYQDILRLPLDAKQDAELGRRFTALAADKVRKCSMVPGAREVLEQLSGRVPMAVVSGTPDGELKDIVQDRGLARYFEAVHGSPPGKTELILGLLAKHRWHPDKVVMVGDAMTDFEAAQQSGVCFVGRKPSQGNPFPSGTVVLDDLTHLIPAIAARA